MTRHAPKWSDAEIEWWAEKMLYSLTASIPTISAKPRTKRFGAFDLDDSGNRAISETYGGR